MDANGLTARSAEPKHIVTTAMIPRHRTTHRDGACYGNAYGIVSPYRDLHGWPLLGSALTRALFEERTCQSCTCTHAACRHGLQDSMRCSWKARRAALWAPAPGTVIQRMLKVGALRNDFTYGKLFHQLEEIVSELLRYLWKIPSGAHQSLSGVVTFCGNG